MIGVIAWCHLRLVHHVPNSADEEIPSQCGTRKAANGPVELGDPPGDIAGILRVHGFFAALLAPRQNYLHRAKDGERSITLARRDVEDCEIRWVCLALLARLSELHPIFSIGNHPIKRSGTESRHLHRKNTPHIGDDNHPQ